MVGALRRRGQKAGSIVCRWSQCKLRSFLNPPSQSLEKIQFLYVILDTTSSLLNTPQFSVPRLENTKHVSPELQEKVYGQASRAFEWPHQSDSTFVHTLFIPIWCLFSCRSKQVVMWTYYLPQLRSCAIRAFEKEFPGCRYRVGLC